jgi:hypothetical protein
VAIKWTIHQCKICNNVNRSLRSWILHWWQGIWRPVANKTQKSIIDDQTPTLTKKELQANKHVAVASKTQAFMSNFSTSNSSLLDILKQCVAADKDLISLKHGSSKRNYCEITPKLSKFIHLEIFLYASPCSAFQSCIVHICIFAFKHAAIWLIWRNLNKIYFFVA